MKVSYFENHRLMFILQYAIFAFIWGEHRKLSTRGLVFSPMDDNLMFTSYEHSNFFIIPKLFQDVYNLNVLFFRRHQNNFRNRKYNCGIEQKIKMSTHFRLAVVVDQETTYWLPLHYICLGCSSTCPPRQQIFRERSTLSHTSGAF